MKGCFKVLDEKNRILLPLELREQAGIQKNDVVQLYCYGKVILLKKIKVPSENLIQEVQTEINREQFEKKLEIERIRDRLKEMFDSGATLEEVAEEIFEFLV